MKKTSPKKKWPAKYFDDRQRKWCARYEHETLFEPLMCDYISGHETFYEAAIKSIRWFECWSGDVMLRITQGETPGSEGDDGVDDLIFYGKY